ncbi:MAG: hypothetical protein NTW09_04695 [Candidatus Omnitrophica bacterium]|nr:hypothetical protein [Candidatus Omnitrophota bacterium]
MDLFTKDELRKTKGENEPLVVARSLLILLFMWKSLSMKVIEPRP